jgi:hypothetical protein
VPFQRCCLPPYQGWQAVVPLFVSLARLAVVPLRGWMVLLQPAARLEWLYDVAAISVMLAASVLGLVFLGWPPHQSGSFSPWRKKRPLRDLEQANSSRSYEGV